MSEQTDDSRGPDVTRRIDDPSRPDFKSRRPPTRAISAEAFNHGNALSFENQQTLKSLFEVLNDNSQEVTFVVGAGVSVDSGFPTWSALVDRLASRIENPIFRRLAKLDSDGPMRHAETIFRMLEPDETNIDAITLGECLYRGMPKTEPGPIASVIAKIWTRRSPRITLMTTNFDDVLEQALETEIGENFFPQASPFSLYRPGEEDDVVDDHAQEWNGVVDWRRARSEPDIAPVLHLHGMVRRRALPLRPVVLSESHFLWHGPKVREVLLERLENSVVVFIGVSLNDPNLVGPLWDVRRKVDADLRQQCFVLHVPSSVTGAKDVEELRSYALAKYEYMESGLGVTPIFLKSYSQLYQVFLEMDLSLTEPNYLATEASGSNAYGHRLERRLTQAYRAVIDGDADSPNSLPSADFSRSLSLLLRSSDVTMPDQSPCLGSLLTHLEPRVRLRHGKLRRKYRDFETDPERFGLFLWLRTLPLPDEAAPYGLNLVASSAYVHHEQWSMHRRVLIEPESPVPVAESVFSGLPLLRNLPPAGLFTQWKGALTVPLRMTSGTGSHAVDEVTIGAIALNTTHYVRPSKSEQGAVSTLAAIWEIQDERDRLTRELTTSIANLLAEAQVK